MRPTFQNCHKNKGFTLIELLLSISLIAVVTGIGAPIFARSQTKNDLDTAVETWVESIRRAEILSQANDGDSTWGVHLETGSITIFKGSSFAARDTNYDEVFSLSPAISSTGVTDLVMSKMTGYPNTTGTTTMTSNTNVVDTATITVNSSGMVQW